ncbi:MAG: peptide chain release factor N(5)-glutamine methyltransferase [Turicibacter sp.]|nr:peptide chain release factor N(5)-glutamine methyltransferase [Turicibacter sp.]
MTLKQAFSMCNSHEAIWIIEKATGLTPTQIRLSLPDTELTETAADFFLFLLKQRQNGTPLQYILGDWDFMGLTMKCGPGVLIPRKDTEILAEEAIAFVSTLPKMPAVLDLCTGTGCIGISIAKFCPFAVVTLSDVSETALAFARENVDLNGNHARISVVQSDLFERITGRFSCITANPPYIPTAEIAELPAEVQKEPVSALDGGADGLAFYRRIIQDCHEFLLPRGAIYLEIGDSQAKAVAALLHENNFRSVVTIKDLEERNRVVKAIRGK